MKVYKYGARAPTSGLGEILAELRAAHRYRNRLVELELARRACVDFGLNRDEIKQVRAIESKALRKASGIGWGTYQLIEQDLKRAARTRSPRFRRFDGTGRIGAPIQSCSELTVSDLYRDGAPAHLSDAHGLAVLRFRLRKDVCATIPVKLHREMPPDERIVRCALHVDRIGTRWVYSVTFTLQGQSDGYRNPDHAMKSKDGGRVAVNFGWRRVPSGVRIAYAVSDDGREIELVLPRSITDKLRHAESLRSLADEVAHDFLGDARRRSRARREALAVPALCPSVALKPFDAASADRGDHGDLEHWARRDRHLYQWESDERAHALRARNEIYRLWARALAREFSSVVVEDFNLARLIMRENPVEIPEARHVRFLVAPSLLRNEIKAVFGDTAKLVKGTKLTATCHACGHECKWDQARELEHRCERCGALWDQDANNATNQLSADAAE